MAFDVHDTEKLYLYGMYTQGLIRAAGMLSENLAAIQRGETLPYKDSDFEKMIEELGIHHNAIITECQRGAK